MSNPNSEIVYVLELAKALVLNKKAKTKIKTPNLKFFFIFSHLSASFKIIRQNSYSCQVRDKKFIMN